MAKISDLFNIFSKTFRKNDILDEEREQKNSLGRTQEEIDQEMGPGDDFLDLSQMSFDDYFGSKSARMAFYRQMSIFPEVTDAIDHICDDAIVDDGRGVILTLNMKREIPKSIEKKVRIEFEHIITNVFKVTERGWDMFQKWLIEGELYLEIILNDKKNSISGVKLLPAYTMTPVYAGNMIKKFVQRTNTRTSFGQNDANNFGHANEQKGLTKSLDGLTESQIFESNQVLYINYGKYGRNKLDVRGYLEPAIRPYNQLRNIEDALVIYRLVRAPERRLWNIDTGRMAKGKAEEYIKKLINKYKKRLNYNPKDGSINSSQNIQAMTEDFWFAKSDSPGGGSTVESISSGVNLGEVEDVLYFLKKLYKTLKLPRTRWEENGVYSSGKIGEVTREEIKFTRFIQRLQLRFKKIFVDALLLQLKMKKIDKKWLQPTLYEVKFTESNLFKEFKERELIKDQVDMWSSISSFVVTPDNASSDGVFSRQFAMKRFMRLSDELYNENEKLRKKELNTLDTDFPTDNPEPTTEPETPVEPEPEQPDEEL